MRYFGELLLIVSLLEGTQGFVSPLVSPHDTSIYSRQLHTRTAPKPVVGSSASSTALNVWWFGGSPTEQSTLQQQDDDSCELVAVRIERPSSNSRKIFGEILVPVPLEDVWAILTDYDRLAVHVPNLVESRIVQRQSGGEQGDGSFRCRLFQKGAQKIVGFEFGATVTMDMREMAFDLPPYALNGNARRERMIDFKCAESFFFNVFDGQWKVVEQIGPDGEPESMLSYVVDVRPNGPVPVAALEWRIREDVPTNLRAVKKAAMEVGQQGVQAARAPRSGASPAPRRPPSRAAALSSVQSNAAQRSPSRQQQQQSEAPVAPRAQSADGQRKLKQVWVQWEQSETMAAYLDKK